MNFKTNPEFHLDPLTSWLLRFGQAVDG